MYYRIREKPKARTTGSDSPQKPSLAAWYGAEKGWFSGSCKWSAVPPGLAYAGQLVYKSTSRLVSVHFYCILEKKPWSNSLHQNLRKRTSSSPVQHIEQSKCIILTVDTNIQLTLYKALHFPEGPLKIDFFNNCYKYGSFALLNGWNVTKTSFDHTRAGMEV